MLRAMAGFDWTVDEETDQPQEANSVQLDGVTTNRLIYDGVMAQRCMCSK